MTLGSFPIEIMTQPELFGMEGSKDPKNTGVVLDGAPLPIWTFMGRFDGAGANDFKQGSMNDYRLQYWGVRSGFDPNVLTTENCGRYFIRTWTNGVDSVPVFRYASAANCPHTYVPSECEIIWHNVFSKITKDVDGIRY
ncbi:MAG: hypothetical protein LBU32_20880 [Clostridiales bacterium]|jgi:hypothetical protein|nr:hypothetical protein [Clostridiales bacterium]